MNVLITGATGEVGKGVAHAFLQRGATRLFILGRSKDKLETLKRDYLGDDSRVVAIAADYSTEPGVREASEAVSAVLAGEKLHHVVSCSGPWWPVPSLAAMDPATWRQAFAANVDAHFYTYRYFVGVTAESFQIVNGSAKDGLPQIGLTGITANAVDGLAKVATFENEGKQGAPRVYNVLLSSSVGHGGQRGRTNDPAAYGHAFVAVAFGKVTEPTFKLDDATASKLIASL
jgi:NAD(P)-dependent dehydrogenase (short-subunit alcohol dehydrogenase family)